jgi:hypothetical protein
MVPGVLKLTMPLGSGIVSLAALLRNFSQDKNFASEQIDDQPAWRLRFWG